MHGMETRKYFKINEVTQKRAPSFITGEVGILVRLRRIFATFLLNNRLNRAPSCASSLRV